MGIIRDPEICMSYINTKPTNKSGSSYPKCHKYFKTNPIRVKKAFLANHPANSPVQVLKNLSSVAVFGSDGYLRKSLRSVPGALLTQISAIIHKYNPGLTAGLISTNNTTVSVAFAQTE